MGLFPVLTQVVRDDSSRVGALLEQKTCCVGTPVDGVPCAVRSPGALSL